MYDRRASVLFLIHSLVSAVLASVTLRRRCEALTTGRCNGGPWNSGTRGGRAQVLYGYTGGQRRVLRGDVSLGVGRTGESPSGRRGPRGRADSGESYGYGHEVGVESGHADDVESNQLIQ